MAENESFKVEIVCPDHQFYEGTATMIEFNTSEGERGVYKNHVPETVILQPGVVTIINGAEKKEAAVHGGFAQILGDQIVFMAEAAEWPGEIDVERAREAKERAEKRLAGKAANVDVLRAEMALRRALVRLSVKGNQ